jgi:photosystem II stability/assembly factor-like uncharacterized protein
VSFTEDIKLRQVHFVTADKGWAAGAHGTIIQTKDGGATWTAQVGGDPESAEGDVTLLRFLDEQRGWAIKGGHVLRTADGETWEDLGAGPQYMGELTMTSPTDGVATGWVGMGTVPTTLFKTRDGGKTWKPGQLCAIKAMVGGLNRTFNCSVIRIQFVTQSVGYLVASNQCAGAGCSPPPILGKTEDGGDTWRFFVGPGDPDVVGATDLFFTDENTGIVRTTDGKLSRTTDGGATWTGLLANVGSTGDLGFADPEVGWAIEDQMMSYTVDGGTRWNSRAYRFPEFPTSWSFPRRDRAYVVGDHGMVFRYRVVPVAEPLKASAQPAPVMPGFGSPLERQVPELATFAQDLAVTVDQLPDSTSPGAATAPEAGVNPPAGDGFAQDAAPSPFVGACCGKRINRLEAILGAVLQSLPQFVAKFKNTNLLTAGLRMLVTMPAQLGDLRGAVRDFKSATNKQAAQAALVKVGAAAGSLRQSTQAAFQKEVTP